MDGNIMLLDRDVIILYLWFLLFYFTSEVSYLSLMFNGVFLYAVLMMKYCWNKCLNVRRGSTLSDLFTPCITQAHLACGKPSNPSWPGPA